MDWRKYCRNDESPDYYDTGYEPLEHPEFKNNSHSWGCICLDCQEVMESEGWTNGVRERILNGKAQR